MFFDKRRKQRSDIFTVGRKYVYGSRETKNPAKKKKTGFERPPFVVEFKSDILAPFIAIGIHTRPDDKGSITESEIDLLVDVYDDAKDYLGTSDAIIMGDFNAGCSYVSDWSSIRLATDHRFRWLIKDDEDTTLSTRKCPYDRLVVAGQNMIDAVDPLSPSVFHFDSEFGLSSSEAEDECLKIQALNKPCPLYENKPRPIPSCFHPPKSEAVWIGL
eukprot:gene205-9838_t